VVLSFRARLRKYRLGICRAERASRLDAVPFGGGRPWFRCTATADGRYCGRRVAKLYLGGSAVFACRQCYGLAYASQLESLRHRGIGKARKIRMRLGGGANILDSFPAKPQRMHCAHTTSCVTFTISPEPDAELPSGIPAVRLIAGFNAPDSNLRLLLTAAETRDKVHPDELDQALRLATTLTWQALAAPDETPSSLAVGRLNTPRFLPPDPAHDRDLVCRHIILRVRANPNLLFRRRYDAALFQNSSGASAANMQRRDTMISVEHAQAVLQPYRDWRPLEGAILDQVSAGR
jgi:hypothetical protein